MSKKVLVAEDYDDVRDMMAILLRLHGFEVVEAVDGREAVDKTIEERPDIVLMDLGMPFMDGFEAVSIIRRNPKVSDTPIIAVTAYSNSYRARALEAGCDHVLQKPLEFEQLAPLLKRFALEP